MKRLYYLTRDIDSVDAISDRLHKAGISDWNFHVLSKNKSELHKHHLHSTNPWHELDIVRGGERGVLMGLMVGFLVLATLAFVFNIALHWMIAVSILALITLFGTWVGGMIGLSTENYKIRKFHDKIDQGYMLLMVDVARDQAEAFAFIINQYATVHAAGEDSTVVNPFENPIAH
jgi:hypothetical protein